jgi:hypothetical protein
MLPELLKTRTAKFLTEGTEKIKQKKTITLNGKSIEIN